ncbi:MAG: hypothetical protein H6811_03885 [Phycisphaeraceae bacterium]|nr:hypothetical protein [Phycisphaeraceae bacterium]
MPWNLDGLRANAPVTAPGGVINADTIFEFHQADNRVEATYTGGRIVRGFLVGVITNDTLEFRYCQAHTDGRIDGGASTCSLERTDDGRIRIIERFEWESRGGSGTNVIEQLPADPDQGKMPRTL